MDLLGFSLYWGDESFVEEQIFSLFIFFKLMVVFQCRTFHCYEGKLAHLFLMEPGFFWPCLQRPSPLGEDKGILLEDLHYLTVSFLTMLSLWFCLN